MVKINLLAERKQPKARTAAPIKVEGMGSGPNLLLIGILLLGVALAAGWNWRLNSSIADWKQRHEEADRELERLAEVRKKGEEYKKRKELLARKIDLITNLKKKQAVPVHILDQVSRNLPDFLWLESMSTDSNKISVSGKATNYNSVSNFYTNLTGSGYFSDVALGRTFEVPEGVSFSLTCGFAQAQASSEEESGEGRADDSSIRNENPSRFARDGAPADGRPESTVGAGS
jgi:Tfp pilus assembly protein PilN